MCVSESSWKIALPKTSVLPSLMAFQMLKNEENKPYKAKPIHIYCNMLRCVIIYCLFTNVLCTFQAMQARRTLPLMISLFLSPPFEVQRLPKYVGVTPNYSFIIQFHSNAVFSITSATTTSIIQ